MDERTLVTLAETLQTIPTNSKRYLVEVAAELSQRKLSFCGRGVTLQSPVRSTLAEGSVILQERTEGRRSFVWGLDFYA